MCKSEKLNIFEKLFFEYSECECGEEVSKSRNNRVSKWMRILEYEEDE